MEITYYEELKERCYVCGGVKYKGKGCVSCLIKEKNDKRRNKKPRRKNECFTVYMHCNKQGEVIYIGISRYFSERQLTHKYASSHNKEIDKIYHCVLENSVQMRVYELYYINKYNPKYNIEENNKSDVSFLDSIPKLNFKEYKTGDTL